MEVQQFISIAPWTIIFQILNLLLLMVLFKKYLFKPVTEILEKRQAEIEGHYQEAQQAETDAKAMKADYESKMAGARQEADQDRDGKRQCHVRQHRRGCAHAGRPAQTPCSDRN